MPLTGALVNVRYSTHEHFRSIIKEGLWGFPLDSRGVNKARWERLREGSPVLLYFKHKGIEGIYALCEIIGKEENHKPVDYWTNNPTGYPFHIKLKFIIPKDHKPSPSNPFRLEWFDQVRPIRKEELASYFKVTALKATLDRWSLFVFGDEEGRGITYRYATLEAIINEFKARNIAIKLPPRLGHKEVIDMIYNIGLMQNRYPEKEYPLEDKRIDVVWRRIPKAVPYTVFEVSIGGNLNDDLIKLKHAIDMWNSIAVLVTTSEKAQEAQRWITGTFHEAANAFRVITIEQIKEVYEAKTRWKNLESQLGLT